MSDTRYRRPELDRTEPIRHWSGVFGGTPRRPNGEGGGARPLDGSIPGAVDLGYRVIDEYLRLGQAQAASSTPFAQAAGRSPQRFTEELARSTLDWMASWFDYLQSMSNGSNLRPSGLETRSREVGAFDIEGPAIRPAAPAPAPPQDATPEPEWTRPASAPSPERAEPTPPLVSIDVTSRARTEVTVELKPANGLLQLRAHDLRATDPELPRIAGVEVVTHPAEHRLVVRFSVPDGQPAAVYSGLIVDEQSHLPRGSISVRVFDPSADHA